MDQRVIGGAVVLAVVAIGVGIAAQTPVDEADAPETTTRPAPVVQKPLVVSPSQERLARVRGHLSVSADKIKVLPAGAGARRSPTVLPPLGSRSADRTYLYDPGVAGLAAAMSTIEADVHGCYATHLELHPEAEVGLNIGFRLAPGETEAIPSDVRLIDATDDHRFLLECIAPRVEELRFVPPAEEEMELDWHFEAAG